MRLTRYSDYSVRVLLYLGAQPDRLCSIAEIAKAHEISQNHLMKVVSDLAAAGYVQTLRGRGGGIRLAQPAEAIVIGQVLRHTEGEVDLVGCKDCRLAGACRLPGPLDKALAAFFAVLDEYTLADVLGPGALARLGLV